MTKRIQKYAAVIAACAVALMQLPTTMPVHAGWWDQNWLENWRTTDTTETEEETTTSTTTTASATTAVTTTTGYRFTLWWERTTEAPTETTTATTTTEITTTSAPPTSLTTKTTTTQQTTATTLPTTTTTVPTTTTTATVLITETTTVPATTTATTTLSTTSTTTTAVTTEPTETTTATTVTTSDNEKYFDVEMPDAPNMPDVSYFGEVGNLTAEQVQCLARAVLRCCMDPSQYPLKTDANNRQYRSINLDEIRGLELFLADEENKAETFESMNQVINTVFYNHKECMLADRSFALTSISSTGLVKAHFFEVQLRFKTETLYANDYKRLQQKFDAIYKLADPSWTDVEKALFFHDYIATHYNYDHGSADSDANGNASHYAYGMLENGIGVCQAYTELYNMLLHESGVESYMVTGYKFHPGFDPTLPEDDKDNPRYFASHGWNLLKIDGKYYHVCITSDDISQTRLPNQAGQYLGFAGQISHDCFLVSTEELISGSVDFFVSSASAHRWITTLGENAFDLANSDNMRMGFWKSATSVIQPFNGGWLTKIIPLDSTDKNRAAYTVFTYEKDYDEFIPVFPHVFVESSVWKKRLVKSNPEKEKDQPLDSNYSTFCVYGDVILFTTDGGKALHYAYLKDKTSMELGCNEQELLRGENYGMDPLMFIYGLRIDNESDSLRLYVARTPLTTPDEVSVPMSEVRSLLLQSDSSIRNLLPAEQDPEEELDPNLGPVIPIIGPQQPTPPATESPVTGDLSGNGTLDVMDIVVMARFLSGNDESTPQNLRCMDLVKDNVIDIYDLAKLKWLLLHQK